MIRRFSLNSLLDTNIHGLAIIRNAESFSPTWYRCPAGVWTIGFGTTENSVVGINRQTLTAPITKADAERLLRRSLIQVYEPGVERLVKVLLSENQFSALVSFVYNIGVRRFSHSTLLRKLNQGDVTGAAGEFERWVYAGGKRLRGLVMRRAAERQLFKTMDLLPLRLEVATLDPLPPLRIEPALPSALERLKLRLP